MLRLNAFYNFVREREAIRLRKEAGMPRPWTSDPILAEYKFTNVHREDDWTTRQFKAIYDEAAKRNPEDHAAFVRTAAMFRYFGTADFARAVGFQWTWDPERVKEIAKCRLDEGLKVFTGAYVITNQGIAAPKQNVVVDVFLAGIEENMETILEYTRPMCSWRELYEDVLQDIAGFGGSGFMAKELMLDMMMTPAMPRDTVHDFEEWTPLGPGARRGLNRMLGNPPSKSGLGKHEAILAHLVAIRDYCNSQYNWSERPLTLSDVQFQLCEFDKYERVRLGEGKPRSKYQPREA